MYQLALSLHKCEQGALVLLLVERCSISHRVLSQVSWLYLLPLDGACNLLTADNAAIIGEPVFTEQGE